MRSTRRAARIGFWRGRICTAAIRPRSHYLGALLYELGYIDASTLDATLKIIAETKKLHGEVLVERGDITREQRNKGLVEQACRKIHGLFEYPVGSAFAFYEARASVDEPPLLVDPIVPVWRGVRDSPPDDHMREVLARYPTSAFKMINEAPLDRIALASEEKQIIKLITSRPLTRLQLHASSTVLPTRIDLLLYVLVIAKCVEPVSPSQVAMQAVQMQTVSITPGPPEASIPPPPSSGRLVPPGATPSATWKASAASIAAMGAVRPPSGEMKKPNFRLSNPEMSAAAASIVPAQGPIELGPTGIGLRAANIENEDYFTALGLPEGASTEAVRASYFRLAKLWHPDRIPAELEAFRPEVSAIFAHLTHAHGTLTDEQARRGYLATRARASTAPASIREKKAVPPEMLKEVDKAIARRDFASAEAHGAAARDNYGDDPEALAVYAWALSHASEAPEDVLKAALVHLDKAVSTNDDSVRARYYRGYGPEAARQHERGDARLQPRHEDRSAPPRRPPRAAHLQHAQKVTPRAPSPRTSPQEVERTEYLGVRSLASIRSVRSSRIGITLASRPLKIPSF